MACEVTAPKTPRRVQAHAEDGDNNYMCHATSSFTRTEASSPSASTTEAEADTTTEAANCQNND
eukprot:475049-Karenia_brevis.AAC.1